MTKHTPGPWTIYTNLPEEHDGYIDYGGYRIDADGVEQLAYVWERSARVNPATGEQDLSLPFGSADGEANARLISAAPDMYEALDRLIRIISSNDPWDREHVDDMNEACDAALSALRKAKGDA